MGKIIFKVKQFFSEIKQGFKDLKAEYDIETTCHPHHWKMHKDEYYKKS